MLKEKKTLPDLRIAQAFIERLPTEHPHAPVLIAALREAFEHKKIQKAIKRAVFRMKQQGISMPEEEFRQENPILTKDGVTAEPTAFMGTIDLEGNRAVLLILPARTGSDVGLGIIGDEKGITQFFFGNYGKKRAREIKDLFFSEYQGMTEVSLQTGADARLDWFQINIALYNDKKQRHR